MDYRQYDNAIGRFNSVDALSEIDPDKSPYAFARNSPVVLNDPTGLCPECEDYYEQQGYEPSGGQTYMSSGGAEYTFNEIAGQWDRTDLMNTLDEVVISASGFDGTHGSNDDRAGVDQRDDVDAIDLVDYGVSGLGEANNLMRNLWQGSSNASQWRAAYQASKTLGVGASAIKNGVNPGLKTAGRYLTGAAIAVTAYKVVSTGQVHSSDVLALSMIALGSTGVGAPIATAFFVADLMTLAITGQSIGDHLDNSVGQPLLDFSNGGN